MRTIHAAVFFVVPVVILAVRGIRADEARGDVAPLVAPPLAVPLFPQPTPSQPAPRAAATTSTATRPAAPATDADQLAAAFADLIRDAIPTEYEKKKDWGKTKRVTVGVENTGEGLHLRLRKKEKKLKHGTWKHYRVTLIDPDERFHIRVENLRNIAFGRIGLTLRIDARMHGWARTKVYNRGVHIISISGEGETTVRLEIDCEVGAKIDPTNLLAGVEIDPVVKQARLRLVDFSLDRVGELHGDVVREMSSGLRHAIEDQLEPKKLTKKLNKAIDKKRDRLRFSPQELLASDWRALANDASGETNSVPDSASVRDAGRSR